MKSKVLVATGFVIAASSIACSDGRNDGSSPRDGVVGSAESALSAEQCNYFASGGKTRICHATGSAKNPYVILNVASAACVDAHTHHEGDYVAVGDPTCKGLGCLPLGAPADPTLACCEGLEARNGKCEVADRCLGVTCTPRDACHGSTCDAATGACVEEPLSGNACDDGNACTTHDLCTDGVCIAHGEVQCSEGKCDSATGSCICTPLRGYPDADGDGVTGNPRSFCAEQGLPPGYHPVSTGNDCNDADSSVSEPSTFYPDADQDGFGDPNHGSNHCGQPPGYTTDASDCDDADPAVAAGSTFYADADGDTYGDPTNAVLACHAPPGYTADGNDCDDGSSSVYPGAAEHHDGLDNDCDGTVDEDFPEAGGE